ncbi:MAG: relaxase domain-containing protein [Pseudomonadales bacterium]|nr:relaxase domain-containing protein [Pseudomonadales bacterium]
MLTLAPITSSSDATNYYAMDNYYTKENGVEQSWWQGNGAAELGLEGQIDAEKFQSLLNGEIGDTQLGRETQNGIKHRPGWDLTWSAPKSVSILSEIYGVQDVRNAHEKAVKKTIEAAEKRYAQSRLQVDDKVQFVKTNNVIVAAFTHDVSREQDPQLHTHTIFINATQTDRGWRSLSPERLYKDQKTLGHIYRSTLATELQSMGFQLRPSRHDKSLFEIDGVSDALIDTFSTRSTQIREYFKGKEMDYSPQKAKQVSLITRRKKETLARDDLRSKWLNRVNQEQVHLSPDLYQLVNALQRIDDRHLELDQPNYDTPPAYITEVIPLEAYADTAIPLQEEWHTQPLPMTEKITSAYSPDKDIVVSDKFDIDAVNQIIRKLRGKNGDIAIQSQEEIQILSERFVKRYELEDIKNYKVGDVIKIGKGNEYIRIEAIDIKNNSFKGRVNGQGQAKNIPFEVPKALYTRKKIPLAPGDNIRFTQDIHELNIKKHTKANVVSMKNGTLKVSINGKEIDLDTKKPSHLHIDYNYARTLHSISVRQKKPVIAVFNGSDSDADLFDRLAKAKVSKTFLATDQQKSIIQEQWTSRQQLSAVRVVRRGIRSLSEREMAFTPKQIEANALKFNIEGLPIGVIKSEIDRLLDIQFLIEAPKNSDQKEMLYTTERNIKKEHKLIDYVVTAQQFDKPIMQERKAISQLKRSGLNDQQKEGVIKAVTCSDRIFAIQGDAGVGKTTTLNEYRKLLKKQKVDVIGLAPSHQAVSELSSSLSIQGMTVDRFLVDTKQQDLIKPKKKTVLIVDESSMLSIEKFNKLLSIAEKKNARVLLVGDHKQLESVGAGRAFKIIQDAGIDKAIIDKRMRQKTEQLNKIVGSWMEGDISASIDALNANQGYIQTENEAQSIAALAGSWKELDKKERAVTQIITPTNIQAEHVSKEIRKILKSEGGIKKREYSSPQLKEKYYTEQEKRIANSYKVGDVIRFSVDQIADNKKTLKKDHYYAVQNIDIKTNKITVTDEKNSKPITLDPMKVGANVSGGITAYEKNDIAISVGDKLRWTHQKNKHGLKKNDEVEVRSVSSNHIRIACNGKSVVLKTKELSDAHITYNYSKTAYGVQGQTDKRILALIEGFRRNTTNQRSFLVSLTRASHDVKIFSSSSPAQISKDLIARDASNTTALTKEAIQKRKKIQQESTRQLSR